MASSPILGPPSFLVLRMSPGVSGEEVALGHSLEVQEPGRALSPAPPGPQTHAQAGPRCPCPPRPHRAPGCVAAAAAWYGWCSILDNEIFTGQ